MLQCEERSLSDGQANCTNDGFYESSCSYTCNEGFKLTGDLVAKCVLIGNEIINWDNDMPKCTSKYKFKL